MFTQHHKLWADNKWVFFLQETNDFHDDQVLPTFLQDKNLTVKVDNRQNPDKLSIVSYGSRAKIVTPPIYACNVSSGTVS